MRIFATSLVSAYLLVAACLLASAAHADRYLMLQSGGSPIEISQQTAQSLAPDHWEVWFFKRGMTPMPDQNARGHWGSDEDTSLSKLLGRVKRSIAFDNTYQRWCRCDGGDLVSNNYIGPIAIMPATMQRNAAVEMSVASDLIERSKGSVNRLESWFMTLVNATGGSFTDVTSVEDFERRLQGQARSADPSAIKGFMQNLHNALKDVSRLQDMMHRVGVKEDEVNSQLAAAVDDLQAATTSALQVKGLAVNNQASTSNDQDNEQGNCQQGEVEWWNACWVPTNDARWGKRPGCDGCSAGWDCKTGETFFMRGTKPVCYLPGHGMLR